MISWKEVVSNFPNDFAWWGRDTSRPRQITDIQYGITIMGGREVSSPLFVGINEIRPREGDSVARAHFLLGHW